MGETGLAGRAKNVTEALRLGAPLCGSIYGVSERAALELANEIDLEGIPTCPLCLLELAWEIRDGRRPSQALIARTTEWVWMESGDAVHDAVVRARMEERPFAENALAELEEQCGFRSSFARAVVCRLAGELAEELAGE